MSILQRASFVLFYVVLNFPDKYVKGAGVCGMLRHLYVIFTSRFLSVDLYQPETSSSSVTRDHLYLCECVDVHVYILTWLKW